MLLLGLRPSHVYDVLNYALRHVIKSTPSDYAFYRKFRYNLNFNFFRI
jgi:hypothetical protein